MVVGQFGELSGRLTWVGDSGQWVVTMDTMVHTKSCC